LLAASSEHEHEQLHDDCAGEEEDEAGVRLEAKGTRSDAENGCGESADIGGDLWRQCQNNG